MGESKGLRVTQHDALRMRDKRLLGTERFPATRVLTPATSPGPSTAATEDQQLLSG